MGNRLVLVILLGILLALGLSAGYSWYTPRLVAVSPQDGSVVVPAGASILLTFSRPMRTQSVIEHLSIQPATKGEFAWQGNILIFTPDQPWKSGTTVRVLLQAGVRADSFPSLSLRQEQSWSFRIRQPELAYLYPSDGPANIFALNPLSGESALLTNHLAGVEDFSVNANGTAIYYSARNARGGSDIYRLDLNTPDVEPGASQPVPVLTCPQAQCRSPAASPRGDFLAYERTALPGSEQVTYTQVWYLPLPQASSSGSDTPTPGEGTPILAGEPMHQTLLPAWSSTGLLSFYDTNVAAFIILDIENEERIRFPNQTGQPGAWHPNGRDFVAPEIFFLDQGISETLQGLQTFANSRLILFNRLDGSTRNLTPEESMEDIAPAFSPDGMYMAFARKYINIQRWTPGRQVWLMLSGGQEAQQMTNEPDYNHYEFAWNPSGDQLAYVRFNQTTLTEPPEIWLMDPFTGRAVQLIVGGYSPKWIP